MVDRPHTGESAEPERAGRRTPSGDGTSTEQPVRRKARLTLEKQREIIHARRGEMRRFLRPRGAAFGLEIESIRQLPVAATRAGRRVAPTPVSRRSVLRIGFWAGLGVAAAASLGMTADLFYPREVKGFGAEVVAGNLNDFPAGSKTAITAGRLWLVNLTEEQGGPGLLALWWKCPHLGCTVPWRQDFVWTDPDTGQDKTGWFRCPCHGSTFTDAGIRVYGPSARSMDTMALRIDENQRIIVDTGNIMPGGPDNPERALGL